MPLYLVTYESAVDNRHDYGEFWKFLNARQAYRILDSQWILPAAGFDVEKQLYEEIVKLLDRRDRLLIVGIVSHGAHWKDLHLTDSQFRGLLQRA